MELLIFQFIKGRWYSVGRMELKELKKGGSYKDNCAMSSGFIAPERRQETGLSYEISIFPDIRKNSPGFRKISLPCYILHGFE